MVAEHKINPASTVFACQGGRCRRRAKPLGLRRASEGWVQRQV
jgi:hypothetical protein